MLMLIHTITPHLTELRIDQDLQELMRLLEQASDIAAIVDANGCYLAQSAGHMALFGFNHTQPQHGNLALQIGTDALQHLLAEVQTGRQASIHIEVNDRSGTSNQFELRGQQLHNSQGKPQAIALFWHRQGEAPTRGRKAAEALFHTQMQQSSDAICVFDPETLRLCDFNIRFKQLLGVGNDADLPQTLAELVDVAPEVLQANVQHILSEGQLRLEQSCYRRPDGGLIEVDMAASLIYLDNKPFCVVNLHDLSERRAHEHAVRKLAQQDQLTGLPNRVLLFDRLRQGIAVAARYDRQLALMSINLDRFKQINNSLGHTVGDSLLREVAERLQQGMRGSDTVSRLGADEFVVLLPEISSTRDVAMIAEKLIANIARPYHIGNEELVIAPSVGISLYPSDGTAPETLLRNADAALYDAKESGGRTFKFFTQEMNTRASERLALEGRLRKALEKGEFQMHYQPQIDLGSGKIIGCEALIRWIHPELGMVPPLKFIPVAEESKLILPIGEWVLQEACRQNREWQKQGFDPIVMAVNLSALQFHQKCLQENIGEALQRSGLDPQFLELEVTESAIMSDADSVLDTMKQLRDMGLEMAIDDFGTGYSSLSYLKRFPVGKLKIDRSFIRDIHEDPDDAAISTAIISLARSLQLKTVAEGIETDPQLDFLRNHGCDQGQGYLFGKPLPAAQFADLLANWGKTKHY